MVQDKYGKKKSNVYIRIYSEFILRKMEKDKTYGPFLIRL